MLWKKVSFVMLPLFILTMVPAFAEVTSLQTDRELYAIDMNMYFTGTVDSTDSQKLVNLLITDPNGKTVLMTGKFAAPNDTFQITVNTNDQSQFYLKGTYKATAFINSESAGKAIFFDFSPDGSPVIKQITNSKNNTKPSQNVSGSTIQQQTNSSKIEPVLHPNMNITEKVNVTKTVPAKSDNANQLQNAYDLKNILYPIMVACGVGILVFLAYKRMRKLRDGAIQSKSISNAHETNGQEDQAILILKNRLAKGEITLEEFNMMKDVLSEP